jgi:hypothetical protein
LKIINFEVLKKKNLGKFSKNYRTFYPKNCHKALKIWVWDTRSGIRTKPIPDPGSRGQKGTGSRIRIRNTGKDKGQKELAKKYKRKFVLAFLLDSWRIRIRTNIDRSWFRRLKLTDPDSQRWKEPLVTSVADPWHFGVDPDPDLDPQIHASD